MPWKRLASLDWSRLIMGSSHYLRELKSIWKLAMARIGEYRDTGITPVQSKKKCRAVLTAAIMDVFHEGHKKILEEMRRSGDRVIVVLHDDLSCFRIKGKIPIQTVQHRRRNLLLTGLVDEILITKGVDPSDQFRKVIDGYNDIVFVRGNDNEQFPGRYTIEQYGIPIKLMPYTTSVSSTAIRKTLADE